MQITEIPYKFDRETYVSKVLDPLEDKGLISWEDDCGEHGFGFKVKFRKEYSLPDDEELRHEKIMKDFSLIERRSQNITVINEKGKLAVYDNVVDLIKDFVEVRKTYVQKRIDNKIIESEKAFKLAFAKAHFIKKVIAGEIVIQGKTRKALTEELAQIEMYKEHVDKLVGLNIFHITSDEARKLAEEAKAKKEENEYWKSTDVVTEYTKDLEAL